jgi:hypothetical protein
VGPSALEVVIVRMVGAATPEAFVGTRGKPAFGRGEIVSHHVAAGTLDEGGAVTRSYKLYLMPEHTYPLRRGTLAARVVRIGYGRNDCGSALFEVRGIALEVGGDHNVRALEAGVGGERCEELVTLVDVIDLVLNVGDVNTPKLDPSPAFGRDDPHVSCRERVTELVFAREDGGDGDVACQAVYEVACSGYALSPPSSEDEGGVARSFVEGTLGGLDDVDRCFPPECLLFLSVVHTAVPGDANLREA